jgi:hypothetical protein
LILGFKLLVADEATVKQFFVKMRAAPMTRKFHCMVQRADLACFINLAIHDR